MDTATEGYCENLKGASQAMEGAFYPGVHQDVASLPFLMQKLGWL